MKEMFALASKERIKVVYYDFAEPIQGIYITNDNIPPTIGLAYSIKDNYPVLRSTMSEELGHHFTTAGSNIPMQSYCYGSRLTISKSEYAAISWGANYLISDNDLRKALKGGITELNYLAYHFNVTEEIVKIKFNIFTSKLITQNQLFLYHRE